MSDVLDRETVLRLIWQRGSLNPMTCDDELDNHDAALRKERDDARDWIKAARQFAWAHERNCPGYTQGGAHCTCGLDQFLGRPRPYVESWKDQVAALETELATVRRRYAESIEARTSR